MLGLYWLSIYNKCYTLTQLPTDCLREPFRQSNEVWRRWEEVSKQGCSNSWDAIASLHRRQQANRQHICWCQRHRDSGLICFFLGGRIEFYSSKRKRRKVTIQMCQKYILCRRHCLGNERCSSCTEVATRGFAALPGSSKLHSWPNRWTRVEETHLIMTYHDDFTKTARGCCSTCESCSTCARRHRRSGDGEITTRSVIEWLCNRRWCTEFNAKSSCRSGTSQLDEIRATDH